MTAEPAAPAAPSATPPTPPTPPKKRRRWIIVLVVVAVVLLAALVIGFLVADRYARAYAEDYVRDRIILVLGLDPDAEVEVEIPGSVLLQAIGGELAVVDVSVPEMTFGALRGAADVHAEDVPLDALAPVGVLDIEFTVAEEDIDAIAGSLSGLELESVELDDPEIVVETSFGILGIVLPVGMGLEPSAVDGALVFTPTTVLVGDESFAAEDLRSDPIMRFLAGDLLQQQSVCIAQYLPEALTATGVEVRGDDLVLEINGDGAVLGGPEMSTLGSC